MQFLLDNLAIKIQELIDFFISLGYYHNIYEFIPEEKLSKDIEYLYDCLNTTSFLKSEFLKFSGYRIGYRNP